MRGHDQSSRREPKGAWLGLILVAVVMVVARPARSQDEPSDDRRAPSASPGDPVDLAARRVQYWKQGDEQWLLLSGQAAILHGAEGLRAETLVVRVLPTAAPGGGVYRLVVFARNLAPVAGQPRGGTARAVFQTHEPPRLKAYDPGGFVRLDGPPAHDAALARSGFLNPRPTAAPANRGRTVATVSIQPDPTRPGAEPILTAAAAPPAPADAPPGVVVLPDPIPASPPRPVSGAGLRSIPPVMTAPTARADPQVARSATAPTAPTAEADAPAPASDLPPVIEASSGADADKGGDLPAAIETQAVGRNGGQLPDVIEPMEGARAVEELPDPVNPPALESAPMVPELRDEPDRGGPATELAPLPAPGSETTPAPATDGDAEKPRKKKSQREIEKEKNPFTPILPGSQRVTRIFPRNSGPNFSVQRLPVVNGMDTIVIRGGVNIVTRAEQFGEIDISADSAIIWRRIDPDGRKIAAGPNGEEIEDAHQPMEIYLEGNVILRQDERKVAGNGDQKTYRANQAYYDVLYDRFIGLAAELDMFAPTLIAPVKVKSPRIEQYRPLERALNGTWIYGLQEIRAEPTTSTGSRFPTPGYRFDSKSIDITRIRQKVTDPATGRIVNENKKVDPETGKVSDDEEKPEPKEDLSWRIDARQNVFYMGPVPVFYWPRFVGDAEDIEPPLRQFSFRQNNYFGYQALFDFNGFRLIGTKRPTFIDLWNVDVDYLSARSTHFPALGTELGWFGQDLFNDLADPYGKVKDKDRTPSATRDYFGYFDIWGLYDYGRDVLGSGPAIITNNKAAGKKGYQRGGGGPLGAVPAFQNPRGRMAFRHMQRFLPDDAEHQYEDLRFQLEVGFTSDRYFLEEYYKRLFDIGMDQETLLYGIRQKDNWAYTIWTEANLMNWQTETQWLPRLDYYRLGDSLLGNWFTYYQHSGGDYAVTNTASEVNNPNIFAYMPYDPISNTSGVFKAGRAYTSHEVDLKLNFGNFFRLVPYVQGQAVGWSNQLQGVPVGRVWGAVGARAEVMAYKAYPTVQSELFNVHGLNHKISLEADYRNAVSNVNLNAIGVQDDLDDNTYESTRRYLALTNYVGGILPPQYDPRHLILRRALSPITGTTDIQASIETLHLGVHQRLQTKRGPEGRRRIIDYMTLDLDTTYFPYASRDNFNKPFGQNMYNWQWFVGDRTSIMSYGWFEFFNITGNQLYKTNINRNNDPFGLNVVTTGISLNRPPRGSIFIGYSVIDTGPIDTSALTTSVNYWLSPKWYGSFSTMYDFGNGILLSAYGSLTRIGADYLTSIGLTVDPQRQSYMWAVQISPRLSPNIKLGSGVQGGFDPRYAPTQ